MKKSAKMEHAVLEGRAAEMDGNDAKAVHYSTVRAGRVPNSVKLD